MNIVVFATVGTSAFNNEEIAEAWSDRERTRLHAEIKRYREDELKKRESWTVLFNDLVRAHKAFWTLPAEYIRLGDHIRQTSAELTSTMNILDDPGILRKRAVERVVFLSSDTKEGRFAADVNGEVLRSLCKGLDVVVREVPGLDQRFVQVTGALFDMVMQFRGSGANDVLFNITGGYKGTVPSMTALAIEKGWELYYQHESCDFAVEWRFEMEGTGPRRNVQVQETQRKPWRV